MIDLNIPASGEAAVQYWEGGTWRASSRLGNCPPGQVTRLVLRSRGDLSFEERAAFEAFPALRELRIEAGGTVWVKDCFAFAGAAIEQLTIVADKLWPNDGAFHDMPRLRRCTLSCTILDGQHGGLTELLFSNCPQLESVSGYYGGEKVMPSVFRLCRSLRSPMDLVVKDLGYHTFEGCESLQSVHLHNGLVAMGSGAFKGCTALRDIYIPDTVQSLGYATFEDCTSLESVHIPNGITEIGSGVFRNCAVLKKCFLPDNLTVIGQGAFAGCRSLESPWMPKHLAEIGKEAFKGCQAIRKVTLLNEVAKIGEGAFADCPNIRIRCHSGSAAHRYAEEEQIPYELF